MTSSQTQEALERIIDRQEIDDLLTRYATAVDTKDWELYETCFTEDAFIDYESAGGIKGKLPEIRAWLEKTMAMFPTSQHMVINRELVIDGDAATCRAGFYNPMTLPEGEGGGTLLWFDGGYYCDDLVRTDEGWRIKKRVEEFSYSTQQMRLLTAKPGGSEK